MSEKAWCLLRFAIVLPCTTALPAFLPGNVAADSVEELQRRERQVQQVCRDVMEAVVSVDGSSGVIISEDGLVLSQYHVTHVRPGGPFENSYPPGHKVGVVFPDGTEAEAELLGADRECDLSLLQLVGERSYPFVSVDPDAAVNLGDWVLKFGHPGSYQKGRMPVVRLGRVICRIETERLSEFITDCHINGGDSGGPYFDLDGRLVGILGNGTSPPGVVLPERMVSKTRDFWAATSVDRIHAKLAAMRRGEITSLSLPREFPSIYAEARTLGVDDWKHGRKSLSGFESVAAGSRDSVVRILDGTYQAALGTVVERKGVIVTKASQLPEQPRCVTRDGRDVSVSVIGMDPAFDIAVLRADVELTPIAWAEDQNPPIGSLQITPGHHPGSLAVGIISVARRDLSGRIPKEVVRRARRNPDPPEIAGIPVDGRGLVILSVDGNAARSGLEPADELIKLGTANVSSEVDLETAVGNHRAGDIISAVVLRANEKMQFAIELDNRGSPIKTRKFSAPTFVEHDAPVNLEEFGGPVLDSNGHATGVTVAHTEGYGCIAIPGDLIRRIVREQLTE